MWIERGQSAPELDTSAVSRRDLVRRALTVVVTLALAGCRDSGADSRSGRGASPPSRSRQTDVRPTEAGRSDDGEMPIEPWIMDGVTPAERRDGVTPAELRRRRAARAPVTTARENGFRSRDVNVAQSRAPSSFSCDRLPWVTHTTPRHSSPLFPPAACSPCQYVPGVRYVARTPRGGPAVPWSPRTA